VLNGQLDQVRSSGLACLSRSQLRQLLTRPGLLLDLQEEVLTSGGPYWDHVARTLPMMHLRVEQGRDRLPSGRTASPRLTTAAPAAAAARATPWYGRAWLASLATAAALLLAFGAWTWLRPESKPAAAQVAWGWERPGAVKEDAPASEYLEGLASAAQEWRNKRPEDAEGVARRIGEMRQGCSALIRAPHKPLKDEDRKWLVERCKAWSKDFDSALAALDGGEDPVKVRDRMDAVVDKLTKALRERAKQA
jgi:hypothetical protein